MQSKKPTQPTRSTLVQVPRDDGPLTGTGAPHAWLASEVVGLTVESKSAEHLGKIVDVVLHAERAPSYAVLSFGGWLGLGDKLFAMPWSVLGTVTPADGAESGARKLVLGVEKERLRNAPGFDKEHWPYLANADWMTELNSFYGPPHDAPRSSGGDARGKVPYGAWRVSGLKGTHVKSGKGEKIGSFSDVAIDVDGRVSYVAVAVGGLLGLGEHHVAVPWSLLHFAPSGEKDSPPVVTLGMTKKELDKAVGFEEGKEHAAAMTSPAYITRAYEYFDAHPYWPAAQIGGSPVSPA